ncbi:hypothetical protein AB3S75_015521 [Citrus x aurantiifolia]
MTELNHAFGILELRIFVLTLHSLGIVIMLLLLGLIRRWLGSSQNFSDLLQPIQLHCLFSLLPCQKFKIGKFMHL